MSVCWRITDPDLAWRDWFDESDIVAFSPAAGSVHLLTRSAARLLQRLALAPMSTPEIAEFVATDTGVARDTVNESLSELVLTLRDAELIETTAP